MRLPTRMVFNAASALSAVLCVATCALWARSYWRLDLIGAEGEIRPGLPQWGGNGSSAVGRASCEVWQRRDPRAGATPAAAVDFTSRALPPGLADTTDGPGRTPSEFHALGFSLSRQESDPDGGRPVNPGAPARAASRQTVWRVTVPYWQAAALLALIPAVRSPTAFRRWRGRRRRRRGQCPSCGYDLRATPGRCPECGAPPGPAGAR